MSRYTPLISLSFWVHNKDHHLNYYGHNTHRHRYTHTTTYLSCSTIYTTILHHLTHIRSIFCRKVSVNNCPFESIDQSTFLIELRSYFPLIFLQLIHPIRVDMLHMMSFVKNLTYFLSNLKFSNCGRRFVLLQSCQTH